MTELFFFQYNYFYIRFSFCLLWPVGAGLILGQLWIQDIAMLLPRSNANTCLKILVSSPKLMTMWGTDAAAFVTFYFTQCPLAGHLIKSVIASGSMTQGKTTSWLKEKQLFFCLEISLQTKKIINVLSPTCHGIDFFCSFLTVTIYLPLRSRLRAPLECWVTVRESILSVCTLFVSRDTTTLCHWLSLSGLSELPFISDGPLPRSKT